MAVTGFWPVFKNLKATLDYADNPDKTTAPEYLDEDLYAALRYAENDDKTDRKMFVGGINCSAQNAYAEMVAVQRRFGLRGKVVGYHGIQSFRRGRGHTGAGLCNRQENSKKDVGRPVSGAGDRPPEYRQCALPFCCESRVLQGRCKVQKQNRRPQGAA